MNNKKETNLEKDKIAVLLLKLALPAILAQIINVLYIGCILNIFLKLALKR